MTPEQKEEMRKSFEEWFSNNPLPTNGTANQQGEIGYKQEALEWAFQAAYTPRPNLEMVARAIWTEEMQFMGKSETPLDYRKRLAQAAIDAIFNRKG